MVFIRIILFHFLQHLVFTSGYASSGHHKYFRHSLSTDRAALMTFKSVIRSDPNSTLDNWDESGDVCNFTGVFCDKHKHRVVLLDLEDCGLVGPLSPFLSNLTGLRKLLLFDNYFFGIIPSEFSNLRNLHYLLLDGNNLQGSIPESFALFSKLTLIMISDNKLTGALPPSFFANCTTLKNVDLSHNSFRGQIPGEIGNCPNLWNLNLYNNQFTGQLPESLINTSIASLDVEYNYLSGVLPSEIFAKLVRLKNLHLSYNNMSSHDNNTNLGPFFAALGNCSKLIELELAGMGLGGTLPSSIGRLNLTYMLLQENRITGSIPPAIGNNAYLITLNLTSNRLNGSIPAEISRLTKLDQLFLSFNLFSGKIPAALGYLPHLGLLDLSFNNFSGEIPASLGNLVQVNYLFLNNNLLSGSITKTLGQCTDLYKLDLSYNKLTGRIPPEISGIREIRIFFNLSHNQLEGQLPIELSKLENVQEIDLSSNNLTGTIFPQISSCIALRLINLSQNSLEGHLPDTLGDFRGLESIDLSQNHLSGRIPLSLSKVHSLTFINLSYNEFEAVKSERRRKQTTPDLIPNFPRITYRELSEATGGFDEQSLVGTGSYGRVYKGALPDGTTIAVKVLHLQSGNSTKSFNRECQVLKRTRHRNLIRIITACSLPDFKALVLPYMANGSLDSRLYPHTGSGLGSGSSDLTLIQRVNICSDIAEGMAYLHHHSPVRVIHCDLKPSNVLLNDELTALVSDFGIARLVMTAGVGNAAMFENMGNSTANTLCGSIGYIAPEYGFGLNTSTKGDVYSFGVLVLEMVTRKRPTDEMFVGGLSLHRWVKSHYHRRVEKIIDSSLVRASRDQSAEVKRMWDIAIGELIELGILCTQESPSTRPTMLDAADDLDRLKRYLSGDTTATFASSLGISSSTLDDD
ncbi:putative leucine-rich repeat receptor-like serine/threonine-protein kinase At2g24130 isoform X2 [Mangifera indica]|uniref:putative leucine-rich repeat receptor-like serine/threonine-protein kinase At2g24130 isoform X2 n=1 Tax=Mangifera indica TaxID=29780 RepID=UPI001CF96122|nr:putative leucine-rich repeat receptor-like serine/threonine-protein kinase At2g24130 isoform X2 [Mangifera indica]